jgi:hypothetical protein
MPNTPPPWIGLAALVAMFIIPFLPDWLFEGPRTKKHWPRRHICGACGALWSTGHSCTPQTSAANYPPLRAELRRLDQQHNRPQPLIGKETTVPHSKT